jgi:hypothetical protein
MRTLKAILLASAAFVLSGATAQAGSLSLDFDFSTLIARPGQTVTARGTITNIDSSIVDLNGCSLTLPGAYTTDDCAVFLSGTGAPLFLNPGDFATVDLFVFTPADPFPSYGGLQPAGSFTILGTLEVSGYDPNTQNDLLDAPFQTTIVPEPSTFALLALALPFAYRLRRRRA